MKELLWRILFVSCLLYMLACVVWACGWYPDHPTNWDDISLHPFDGD